MASLSVGNRNAEGNDAMTGLPHSQPDSEGHSGASGYACSLLQQALWIEESVDGTVPPSQRIDLGDVDVDELRSAAQYIMQQADDIDRLTERCEAYKGQVHAGSIEIAALKSRVEELTKALEQLDLFLDFSDDDIQSIWTFDDVTGVRNAFNQARRALAMPLERSGGAT